jgi:hypothetical protein
MNRDIRVYLQDIIESIEIIEEYTQELSSEDFFDRRQTQDAVIRRLEIIGEAVKHIPSEKQGRFNSSADGRHNRGKTHPYIGHSDLRRHSFPFVSCPHTYLNFVRSMIFQASSFAGYI